MTDDIEKKRAWVAAHPKWASAKWRKKVQRMPDSQVIAIYMREHGKEQASDTQPKKDPEIPF